MVDGGGFVCFLRRLFLFFANLFCIQQELSSLASSLQQVYETNGFHFCEVYSSSLNKVCRTEHCAAFYGLYVGENTVMKNKILKSILKIKIL